MWIKKNKSSAFAKILKRLALWAIIDNLIFLKCELIKFTVNL